MLVQRSWFVVATVIASLGTSASAQVLTPPRIYSSAPAVIGNAPPPPVTGTFIGNAGAGCGTGLQYLDGRVVTWTSCPEWGQHLHPVGRLLSFDASHGSLFVAVRPDGEVVHWPNCPHYGCPPGDDPMVKVWETQGWGAGLRADGTVRLWGVIWYGQEGIYGGTYRDLATGSHGIVGIRPDWRADAFGSPSFGGFDLPPTRYRQVALGPWHGVGLTASGEVRQWGSTAQGQGAPPEGEFVQVATAWNWSVGLRPDGTVECWGNTPLCGQIEGRFIQVDCSPQEHFVGLRCTEPRSFHYSPELGTVGWQQPRTHLFEGVPTSASGPVRISVIARADLAAANDFLIVRGDGVNLGTVFATSGTNCAEWWDVAVLEIPAATYNSLAEDGSIAITIDASVGVQPSACGDSGSLQLILDVPQPEVDCDGDGFLDHCQIMLNPELDCDGDGALDSCGGSTPKDDCDGNGVSDACEIEKHPYLDCTGLGVLDVCAVAAGLVPDCNGNGVPDSCDILDGASEDKNGNVVPDECEFAYGDFNLDGQIDGADLSMILGLWGLTNPPLGDLTGDGQIDGADLSLILGRWGAVPF